MRKDHSPILIYDGSCPLCTSAAAWVQRQGLSGGVETLPCQSEERGKRFPQIDETACMEAMQLVFPDGRVVSGEQALPHLFRVMRGWRWLAWLMGLPGISHVSPYVYRWVAAHRYMLSIIITSKGAHSEQGSG